MFYETLSDVLDVVDKQILEEKIVLECDYRSSYSTGGINYGETSRTHWEIVSIKGKKTRKYFHVIITRMDNGKYELVSYAS